MKLIVDSYAWVEIFLGSGKGEKAKALIEEAEEGHTPDVVLAEIARKYSREGVEEERIIHRLSMISATTIITPIDLEVAVGVGKAHTELVERARRGKLERPGLFDAIILAIARLYRAKILTGDEHFRGLPETVMI